MKDELIAALAKDFVKSSAVYSYGVENEIDEAADQGRDNLSQIANIIRGSARNPAVQGGEG